MHISSGVFCAFYVNIERVHMMQRDAPKNPIDVSAHYLLSYTDVEDFMRKIPRLSQEAKHILSRSRRATTRCVSGLLCHRINPPSQPHHHHNHTTITATAATAATRPESTTPLLLTLTDGNTLCLWLTPEAMPTP